MKTTSKTPAKLALVALSLLGAGLVAAHADPRVDPRSDRLDPFRGMHVADNFFDGRTLVGGGHEGSTLFGDLTKTGA